MKLKYYLRGLGLGMIVTTMILMISFSQRKNSISDEEIVKRAAQLGMVMQDEHVSEDSKNFTNGMKPDNIEGEAVLEETESSEEARESGETESTDGTKEFEKPESSENTKKPEKAEESDNTKSEKEKASEGVKKSEKPKGSETSEDMGKPEKDDLSKDTKKPEKAEESDNTKKPEKEEMSEEASEANAPSEELYRFKIRRGDFASTVCNKLAKDGVIADSESLQQYMLKTGYAFRMQVGEYEISYGLSDKEIVDILKRGPLP